MSAINTEGMDPVSKAAVAITEAVESRGRIHLGALEAIEAALAAQRVFASEQDGKSPAGSDRRDRSPERAVGPSPTVAESPLRDLG